MAIVEAGGDRQVAHEKIRVLSRGSLKRVKATDATNNLIQLIMIDEFFAPIHGRIDATSAGPRPSSAARRNKLIASG
jgi:adenylosuccinate lyase